MIINSDNMVSSFGSGETQIVLQRHAKYDRNNGVLISTDDTNLVDKNYFENLFSLLCDEEKENLYILFVASDTKDESGLERAYETTNIARGVAFNFFKEYGIPESNIILPRNLAIKKDSNLSEPKMFIDNSGYFEFLKDKYGNLTKDFWIAFEEDLEKEYRLSIFGEGPDEIVDRALMYLSAIKRYSDYFHSVKKNSRLIVWSGTHYDLISPLIKQLVLKLDKEEYVGVENNAGIVITIDEKGRFITSIDGIYYDLGDLNDMQLHRHF